MLFVTGNRGLTHRLTKSVLPVVWNGLRGWMDVIAAPVCAHSAENYTHVRTPTHNTHSLPPSLPLFCLALCFVGCSDSGWSGVTTITSFPFPRCATPNASLSEYSAAIQSADAVLLGGLLRRISHSCGDDGASLRARKAEERRRGVHRHQHPSASSLCVHRRM